MKNTLGGVNSRLDEAEKGSVTVKKGSGTHPNREAKEKRIFVQRKDSLRDLWDNIKQNNIQIKGYVEGEMRKKGEENLSEEMKFENFFTLRRKLTVPQESQRTLNKMNPKRPTPRHIVIKMSKVKDRILKTPREKQFVVYKETPMRLSAEPLQARRE